MDDLIQLFQALVEVVGFDKAVWGIVLIILATFLTAAGWLTLNFFVTWLKTRPQQKLEKEKLIRWKQQQTQVDALYQQTKDMSAHLQDDNKLFSKLIDRLATSVGSNKFAIAVESFIGVSRDFASETKDTLIEWVFNDFKRSGSKLFKAIKDDFKIKVTDRIAYFIFDDDKFVTFAIRLAEERLDAFFSLLVGRIKEEYGKAMNRDSVSIEDMVFAVMESQKALSKQTQLNIDSKENIKLFLLGPSEGVDGVALELFSELKEGYFELMHQAIDVDYLRLTNTPGEIK